MSQLQLMRVPQARETSDDYYTPRHVFDRLAIRFDMDVASPEGGSPWVPADRCLTIEDDGLATPWEGRVWMNPPYSNVRPWWERFAAHGNGVALLPFVKSQWVNDAWERADGIAVGIGRGGEIQYDRPDGTRTSIWSPSFFAAMGDECVEAIGRVGRVRK